LYNGVTKTESTSLGIFERDALILELTGTILLFSEKYGMIRVPRNHATGGRI
jgi:hypothetical protein